MDNPHYVSANLGEAASAYSEFHKAELLVTPDGIKVVQNYAPGKTTDWHITSAHPDYGLVFGMDFVRTLGTALVGIAEWFDDNPSASYADYITTHRLANPTNGSSKLLNSE